MYCFYFNLGVQIEKVEAPDFDNRIGVSPFLTMIRVPFFIFDA